MKRTADRLFGDNYRWSVLGAGRNQLPIAAMSARWAATCASGSEDSLWIGPGQARGVERGASTRGSTGHRRARSFDCNPDEAREILALKGGSKVGF
jgi:uncharacterized protein (DUF849 family)